ncbi:nuclear transport factor 2 family protein [Rhodococcus sp. USK13]|uniref:nuclear transport factor 2 family protein n=1 Tax=Rhodococcus sp. USK13 TaxID=2806442 RepID=UPI001BCEFA80|nr:nuclear transport factor 2 family protein [Rhodococcus sp. USK13]
MNQEFTASRNEATEADPMEVMTRFYAAEVRYIAAGGAARGADFSEMAACMHTDVAMHQGPSTPFPGDWIGVEELERFFANLAETWISMDIRNPHYFAADDGVAIKMQGVLTSRATGMTIETELVQVITMSDGLIRDWTVYWLDPVSLQRACGLI